jgi:TPR repeat protein
MRRLCLAVAVVFGLAAPAGADNEADYEAGKEAYDRGNYATALKEWVPLAEEGDASAQYALGFMYAGGQGVTQDDAEAAKWFRRAAEQGHPDAQFLLGRMYRVSPKTTLRP